MNFRGKNGQATMEFVALFMFVLIALFIGQQFVSRGIMGRWKQVGESFGSGMLWDTNGLSIDCVFDNRSPPDPVTGGTTGLWYDKDCFDSMGGDCLTVARDAASCTGIITLCANTPNGQACNDIQGADPF